MNTTGSRATNAPAPWPDLPRPAMPVSRNFDEWMDRFVVTWRDLRIQLDREFRKSNGSPFFRGMIMAWRRPLVEIPEGWAICNGENGTVDLRGSFIKCVDDGEEPGAIGGSADHTPAGAVAAPAFTGTEGRTSDESAGVLSGVTGATSGGTPTGVNDAPALTMDSYTPAGTNSAPTFTGNAVAAASTNVNPDLVAADVTAGGVSPVTTATGTVSAPTFTGTGAVLTGTVAAPVFTGDLLATHTHTFSGLMGNHSHTFTPAGSNSAPAFVGALGNFEPPFYKLAFIEKL